MSFSLPDVFKLHEAVADAVDTSFAPHQPPRSEPQLVANLVWWLPRKINPIQLNTPMKLSVSGVFVHARSFVACTSFPEVKPASVEIGDLLFICKLVSAEKVRERRALLLQAKKVERFPATPDNPNQWHLYANWPQFTYAGRSDALKGQMRHINEPDMYDAAKYLLIGDGACGVPLHALGYLHAYRCRHWPYACCHQTAHPTQPAISRYRCFAHELVDFLLGNAGKVFVEPLPTGASGWDQVVDDLIQVAARAQSNFMKRASGSAANPNRGVDVFFVPPTQVSAHSSFFRVATAGSDSGGNGETPPRVVENWSADENGGISVIEVIVEDTAG